MPCSATTLIPGLVARGVQFLRHYSSLFLAASGAMMALALPGLVLAQTVSTFAGTGVAGDTGDGGAASAATLRFPSGVAFDSQGNMYFADTANHRVRRIDAVTGNISTVAGNGSMTYSGDGGLATSASLFFPSGVAVDAQGNLYIADTGNARVRKIDAVTGNISTVAGNGTIGYAGEGVAATSASLYYPSSVAVDSGFIYISDTFNHRVRAVSIATNVITTVAGTGTAGFSGDAGPASAAKLYYPEGLAFNGGTLYIADTFNNRIRSVGGAIGAVAITTVAGNGVAGHVGDGGSATAASLKLPVSVSFDSGGNLYVADYGNHRIRVVPATGGMISAFAGAGSAGSSGDGGPAALATFSSPSGVVSNLSGSIYVTDTANHKIRKIGMVSGGAGSVSAVTLNVVKGGTGAAGGTVTSTNTGIACGQTCFEVLPVGTVVTLNASATGGATFAGWSGGGCSGTGACAVTLDAAKTVTATFEGAPAVVRMVNVSTRGSVQTGDNVMIGGFVIAGSSAKTALILARGPSLANAVPNTLPNPRVTLVNQVTGQIITFNDDWGTAANRADIVATGKAPTSDVEAAILITLNPGSYTAVVDGGPSLGTGNGIVEVYEIDHPETPLVNISTRGHVLTGDGALIGGFAISTEGPQQVLILARGPSLANAVPNTLPNPRVTLVNQVTGQIITFNDDWGTAANRADIVATGKAPTSDVEAAILITLNPGSYTAIVDGGPSLGTGNAIIEVYRQ